ncbi:hypothetical protein D1641_00245 [Colidextribacter sp. OB.20]|uniref:hypothetical protein n=1 Tax=Colidextribacter sp. OB.20 TaxID=2304568 RepID=UPI00136F3696|nr:hypothetical protein [Colidextribacter sp. OB.20]NBI08450.1 hypothetical protein [Colidextribacter sp. OB.20]
MSIQMMEGFSGVSPNIKLPGTAIEAQKPEAQSRPREPVMDEYVPEEPREPSGRYWMGRDEDGQPRIYFDDPEKPEDIPDAEQPDQAGRGPKRNGGEKEVCEGSTDQVDREIEQLKKRRAELEQRLNAETDEAKIKDLERQLTQTERELKQKDNDTYRRQHTKITRLD